MPPAATLWAGSVKGKSPQPEVGINRQTGHCKRIEDRSLGFDPSQAHLPESLACQRGKPESCSLPGSGWHGGPGKETRVMQWT
jgi:hypothetical protein